MLNKKYTQIENDTGTVTMVAPPFFFWITENDRSIYYQKEEFYEGEELPPMDWKDVPAFFWRVVRESYPQSVIDREKLIFPEERKLNLEERIEKREEKEVILEKCGECDEMVPKKEMWLHIGRHTKAANKVKRDAEKNLAQV